MIWLVLALALAVGYLMFNASRTSEPVAVAAAELGTDGTIDAIEYFWRPG